MSNIENEINNIFYDYNNTQNFNEVSPKIEDSTRGLYHRETHIAKSNDKVRDGVEDDIMSKSQISRAHKFNIKRFSAVDEKIVKSKSPPKSISVLKQKTLTPSILKLKQNKKINYRKIEKPSEEKSPTKKKSIGKKSSCDIIEMNTRNLY
jgi:hypothetical protein